MNTVFWSFWLKRKDNTPSPTAAEVEQAFRAALPDFVFSFALDETTGNPRDGYLHGVLCSATQGKTTIMCDVGVWSSFGPELIQHDPNQPTYEILSVTPRITSNEPWEIQQSWWSAIATAFIPLGFTDLTRITPVFMKNIEKAIAELN